MPGELSAAAKPPSPPLPQRQPPCSYPQRTLAAALSIECCCALSARGGQTHNPAFRSPLPAAAPIAVPVPHLVLSPPVPRRRLLEHVPRVTAAAPAAAAAAPAVPPPVLVPVVVAAPAVPVPVKVPAAPVMVAPAPAAVVVPATPPVPVEVAAARLRHTEPALDDETD